MGTGPSGGLADQVAQVTSSTWVPPRYGDVDGHSWYRVAYLGGIEVRMQPSVLAPRTGEILPQNEVFAVSADIVGADGRIYLKLADGRGWAFDDSALMPHDPSVVRGHFAVANNEAAYPGTGVIPHQYAGEPASMPYAYSSGAGFPVEHASHTDTMVNSVPDTYSSFNQSEVMGASCTTPLAQHSTAPTHAQSSQPWNGVVNNYHPAHAAWSAPVTKDCPPMWEASVGP